MSAPLFFRRSFLRLGIWDSSTPVNPVRQAFVQPFGTEARGSDPLYDAALPPPRSVTGWATTEALPATALPQLQYRRFRSEMPQDPFDRVFYMEDVKDPSLVVGRTLDRRRYEQFIKDPQWLRRYGFALSMMRIAKAVYARERFAVVYASPLVRSVVHSMQEHGVLAGFRDLGNKEMFTVELKYWNDMPVIGAIRVYTDHETARYWDRTWCKKWLQRFDVVDDDRLFLFQTLDGPLVVIVCATMAMWCLFHCRAGCGSEAVSEIKNQVRTSPSERGANAAG